MIFWIGLIDIDVKYIGSVFQSPKINQVNCDYGTTSRLDESDRTDLLC